MKLRKDDDKDSAGFTPWDEYSFESYRELLKDRTILFSGEVKENIIERVALPINALAQRSIKPIKLIINSPGGQVEAGQAVVDAILTSRAPVITIAMGQAMSAAFDIYLAGDRRIMYPNTILMCHSGSSLFEKQTLPAINVEAKLHAKYFQAWSDFYSSRTKIKKDEWLSLLNSGLNRYFFADECLATNIAHEVIQIPKKNLTHLFKGKNV
jgi:ATP-dependent protease ClpP protease subunit